MTKILEIIADGNPGGGTTHLLQILRGLADQYKFGLATQKDSYLIKEARKLEIQCFDVDFFTSRVDFRIPIRLHHIHKQFLPGITHVHGVRAGWANSLAYQPTPIIYSVHGYPFLVKQFIQHNASILVERYVSKHSKIVLFESNFDKGIANKYKLLNEAQPSLVINNAIELTEVEHINPKPEVIGFVGRLVPQKDPFLFIEVMSRLNDFQAHMIGEGNLEDALKEEMKKRDMMNISMLGVYPHQKVLKALCNFRVIVMTSQWEGFPYLPIEAMWRGVPVIAPNVGGIDEIIENRVSGILIDSRSPDDFVDAVLELENNTQLRNRIIKEGKKRVKERFSVIKMVADIKEVYDTLLQQE